jgi:hypothetical protein
MREGEGEGGQAQEGGPAVNIDETLKDRRGTHGDYREQCRVTSAVKRAMYDSGNWGILDEDMKEAMEMIAVKIGRLLTGSFHHHDSWHDIVGYAKLVADRLANVERPTVSGQTALVGGEKPEKPDRWLCPYCGVYHLMGHECAAR